MIVTIVPNEKGFPPGKLADAELYFEESPLQGLKLVGFGIWKARDGNGRNVTFPTRRYSVNGERRTFTLLRPIDNADNADQIKTLILDAHQEFEKQASIGR